MEEQYQILQMCLSSSWGGLEMVALEMAEYYKKQGILTCASINAVLTKKLSEKGLSAIELPGNKKSYISRAVALRKLITTKDIKVILVQQLHDLWYLRLALLGLKGPRVVGLSHTLVSVSKKDFLHRWIYALVDQLVCLTQVHKKNLLAHLPVDEKKLTVIPNAVSTKKFSPTKKSSEICEQWKTSDEQVLIGLVGRLDAGKGQQVLLEATKILRSQGRQNFKIILVGEDTLNNRGTGQKLKDFVRENKLQEAVVFTGFRQDIPEIMASLDILVMASEAETFGRVIIEGMAAGVTVVGTKAGGVVNIIDDEVNGLLVPQSSQALAEALSRLINDKALREQMRTEALKKARSVYDENVVMPQVSKVLGL